MYPPEITERLESTEEEMAAAWIGERPPAEPIVVEDYDPEWPAIFDTAADDIRESLGDRVIALEHIGSTAVPGLAAKPIVDIDLLIADSADESSYVDALEGIGYRLVLREPNWHEHRMFRADEPAINLHVFSPEAPEHIRHLVLRDWLRTHDDDRMRYESAKRRLAADTAEDPHAYNLAKNTVIDEIYARAFGSPRR